MSETGNGAEAGKFIEFKAEKASPDGEKEVNQNQKDRMRLATASVKKQEKSLKEMIPTISVYTSIDEGMDVNGFSAEPLTEEETKKIKNLDEKEKALSENKTFSFDKIKSSY